MQTNNFIPGLQLAERLYQEWVAPALQCHWPQLRYSACLIGDGSEVLGFDTFRSMDHDWGPRLYLFLGKSDFAQAAEICAFFDEHLPASLGGIPVTFADGDRCPGFEPQALRCGSPQHGIEFFELESFFKAYLGQSLSSLQTDQDGHNWQNWLVLPEARLLALTAGRVFYDALGLQALRQQLAYYPHDLWLYLMACQWLRIAQLEAFVGRGDEVGDSLGAQLITSQLVHELMGLAFLQEKCYRPYAKWLGRAFQQLQSAPVLSPLLQAALQARTAQERETSLGQIYGQLAQQHNALGLTPPLAENTRFYHDRPYQVIGAERFVQALWQAIQDPEIKALPPVGSINQWAQSTDILTWPTRCQALKAMFS